MIFGEDVTEEKGENARLSAFVGAIAVGDLVKSTLGPKGMDKILQSASTGEIMVTNDGATILKAIALDNAAAKVLVNISKVQDDVVGDGTTSVTVLAAELLREAEKLVEKKIHPQVIIDGYRIASRAALEALEASAVDNSADPVAFRKDLHAIARTTLSSKVLSQDRDQFANLACDAVLRLKGSTDLSHIQIIKKAGGKLSDSYLDEGFILDKSIGVNQPKRLEKAKILVANTGMDTDKVKIFGARVKVDSTGKLADLEKAEKEKMRAKVERIKAHGINCFVNRQLIYNWPEQLFTDAGIVSIEHADFDGIERLALVTGGEIASTFDHPDQVKLGHCDLIEEVIIGEDTLIKFSGVAAGQACTIVLRGATGQLLDEADRSLHDALAVLSQTVKEPKVTLGGGCAEMVMAKAVEHAAQNTTGKKQLAVDAFAQALKQLPIILADNAGLDSSDLVTRLRQAINKGLTSSGLDLLTPGGGIANMRELGVVESYKLKHAVVSSASEAAEHFEQASAFHRDPSPALKSDNHRDMQGELKGTATFKPACNGRSGIPNDLVYEEQGEMRDPSGRNSTRMKWSRRYMWRLSDSSLSVWFVKVNMESSKESAQDGQTEDLPDYIFHQLRFMDEDEGEKGDLEVTDLVPPATASDEGETAVLFARGSHLCIKDNYETTYAFRVSKGCFGCIHNWASSHVVEGPKKSQRIVNMYTRAP
ncbi:T-complex protein 1 [Trichophyton rubrum]|uniref:CCT-beta n=1 Tax=Trichophyton rubrum TaxID=5551 RepID=A0A178EZ13_TRIRU|nr:T-complex protein 1 [Trichophyton rubrum]